MNWEHAEYARKTDWVRFDWVGRSVAMIAAMFAEIVPRVEFFVADEETLIALAVS
jgi:hypothetical protein